VAETEGRQESEKRDKEEPERRYKPQELTPSDLLPQARPHFLKVPESPKRVLPIGDQVFNSEPVGDISYSNHNILTLDPKGSSPSHNAKCI
jgi:hypothetical protein